MESGFYPVEKTNAQNPAAFKTRLNIPTLPNSIR